jgi:hypothetical protein
MLKMLAPPPLASAFAGLARFGAAIPSTR